MDANPSPDAPSPADVIARAAGEWLDAFTRVGFERDEALDLVKIMLRNH
jgi:hypothetical protein